MAIVLVASAQNETLVANNTITVPAPAGTINTTGANLIVVFVCTSNAGSLPTLVDSKGNTYIPLTQYNGVEYGRLWYCLNPIVGSGHTFTFTTSTNSFPRVTVTAWSGIAISSAFDTENGNGSGSNVTSLNTGSVTPSQNGSLIVTGSGHDFSGVSAIGINSGFTLGPTTPIGLSSQAYLIQMAAAAINPTWNWTTSTTVANAIAVFKPSSIPGGASFPALRINA